jgi:radical SAM superfamily enzyme YgiQ (UPF0313 family)
MGKKILFLIKNERNQRYGIISLAAVLKEKEHVLDYVFINREDELPLVLNKIKNFQPAYLAISAMSGEVMFYLSILKSIKEVYPNQYVVMGGPHPTFDKSIIKNPYIDAICSGEGEEAFVEFLDKHPDGDYISVKNFSFKEKNGRIITNPLRPLIDINTLPIPDYDFFPLQSTDKIISFSSRNCVYRCTYCFNRDYSNKYKEIGVKQIYSVMDVDKYLNTLKYLKNKYEGKFKYFHFLDDVFPIKKDWLNKFAERYPKEIGLPFRVGLNPIMIRENIIALLRKAGCSSLNFAIESGSERIRNKIMLRPSVTNKQMIELSKIIRKYNIYIFTQNIMMSPTETLKEAKQTLDLNIACKVNSASTAKFQPYPGTAMAKFAVEKGLVQQGNILEMLPENYHHVSIVKFDKKDEIGMSNLVKMFSFTVKFPFMKNLVYALIPYKSLEKVFERIDDQFWMTYTHRSTESINKNNLWLEFKLLMLFIKRLIFPLSKEKFIYYG